MQRHEITTGEVSNTERPSHAWSPAIGCAVGVDRW